MSIVITKGEKIVVADSVNKSTSKNFTILPNEILKSPEISAKAKIVLAIGLSNKDGWFSYQSTVQSMMKEGENAVTNAFKELQKLGYMKKVRYRDKQTKQVKGSFKMYTDTPYKFTSIDDIAEELAEVGMEMFPTDILESHIYGNLPDGTLPDGNQGLIILNKKDKINKTKEEKKREEEETTKNKNEIEVNNCPYEKIESLYHSICKSLPKIRLLSNNRKKSIKARWLQYGCKLDIFEETFQKAEQSNFLKGKNDRGWIATFDWLMNEHNMAKVLEGNYDDDKDKLSSNKLSSVISPTSTKSTSSPRKIIALHFRNKDLSSPFYQSCFLPAKRLFSSNNLDENKLATQLITFHSQIGQEQHRNLDLTLMSILPGPMRLIEDYIEWITDSTWISNMRIDMFDIQHSLFTKFRREEAKKDNLERDALTGRSYMRG